MVDPRTASRLAFQSLFLFLVLLILFLRLLPLSMLPDVWPLPAADGGADAGLALSAELARAGFSIVPDHRLGAAPTGLHAGSGGGRRLSAGRSADHAAAGTLGVDCADRHRIPAQTRKCDPRSAFRVGMADGGCGHGRDGPGLSVHPCAVHHSTGGTFGPAALQLLATVAIYPLVALALQVAFGLRRAAPGEIDVFGQRL